MCAVAIPDWRTSSAGSRARVALWLVTEVGVDGVFTKGQLRQAFPKVEQIDRRMRDLRPEGWVINTYREDRSLTVDELRLVSIGGAVWSPSYRPRQSPAVTDKERQATFAADNYVCVLCGVGGGEPYQDDPARTAKLALKRTTALLEGPGELQTLCDRCYASAENAGPESVDSLIAAFDALDREQLERLGTWIRRGRRLGSPVDDLWARYRRLPARAREVVRSRLEQR
jgi:hypothetical protein